MFIFADVAAHCCTFGPFMYVRRRLDLSNGLHITSAKINISYSILFNLTTSYSSYFRGKKGISRNKTSFFLLMNIIVMICISEIIESLEEEFDCASFSGEDHWHAALQGAICSCLGCCSWLRGCASCNRCWSASTTSTTPTASMSGWLLRGLLDLSASTSSCNR